MTDKATVTDDQKRFNEKLIRIGKALERRLDRDTLDVYWELVRHVPVDVLIDAIDAHLRDPDVRSSFPRPSDILRYVPCNPRSQHLNSDEAWALAIVAAEEKNTVVWTTAMQSAWHLCSSVYAEDPVGARVAFRSAYERIVREARARHLPPSWVVSLGWDKEQRRQAVDQAVHLGRISQTVAQRCIGQTPMAPDKKLLGVMAKSNAFKQLKK